MYHKAFQCLLFLLLNFSKPISADISPNLYNNITHYAHYCKLTHCIAKPGMLVEGLSFPHGGCLIEFCQRERNSDTIVLKIHDASANGNSGTSFITIDGKNKEIVIAFRASVTSTDWFSDFYMVKTPYNPTVRYGEGILTCKGCMVHLGFYQHMTSIHSEVINSVLAVYRKFPTYNLVLVGHSLGAALASLTAIEFRMLGFYPTLYTFGGPRIFNDEMARWVNEIFSSEQITKGIEKGGDDVQSGFLRVIHEGDYVTTLPPLFKQAGVELNINKRELPHDTSDVEVLGTQYDSAPTQSTITGDLFWRLVHGYEHRTYFMTLNKCDDVDMMDELEIDAMDDD